MGQLARLCLAAAVLVAGCLLFVFVRPADPPFSWELFAEIYTPPTPTPVPIALDADGDGEVDALTDGLLVLRWLFEFTGPALVAGVVDLLHCSRCSDAEVAGFLASVAAALDIDGDGVLNALTDGILVLRWLFGFTGSTLVTGAVDPDCVRCSAADIATYLDSIDG